MTDVDPTRRAFLLAAGLGLGLVGAATVDSGDDVPDVSYDADALARVASLGSPRASESLPITVEPTHVAAHRERAEALLDAAPEAPGIPNEAIAREYDDRYTDAVDALAEAAAARRPADRLASLRWARHRAADVNAVAAALAGELTREAVLAGREAVRESLERLRKRWRYRGDDPAVAVAVHSDVEGHVAHAEGLLEQAGDGGRRSGSRVLDVGSSAGDVELARAVVADATYLRDRFVDGLDDARVLRPAFDRAARTLVADVVARCPDEDSEGWESQGGRDREGTVAEPLLRSARSEVRRHCYRLREARERTGVATTVLAAGTADRDRRGLDAVETAVRRGEYSLPRSVDPVRGEKLAALEAVEAATAATPTAVAVPWAGEAVGSIRRGDDRLSHAVDHDRPGARVVGDAVAAYAWGRHRAAAVPDALARLGGVLDAAATATTAENRGD